MPDVDPALLSATDMLAAFARRQLTPVDVLQAITERVARLNPGLNAFAVMNPGALQAAAESTSRWRSGRPVGIARRCPLHRERSCRSCGFPNAPRQPHHQHRPGSRRRTDGSRPEGGRRGDPGQDDNNGVRLEIPRRQPAARHHPQPMEPGLHHRRVFLRRGRGRRRRVRATTHRHRRRRVGAHPGRVVRACRLQTHLRPHSTMAGERVRECRCRWPDDPHRARCRSDVLRHGAMGPAGPVLPAR